MPCPRGHYRRFTWAQEQESPTDLRGNSERDGGRKARLQRARNFLMTRQLLVQGPDHGGLRNAAARGNATTCHRKLERRTEMSNWIDWDLDVLASNPDEINHISERLNQPSPELVNWIAQRFEQPVSEVIEGLTELLEFKVVRNLGYVDNTVNKARRFSIEFKDKRDGIVRSHLFEISEAFPAAIFLLEYRDTQASYTGKHVIRAGEVVQEAFDGNQ